MKTMKMILAMAIVCATSVNGFAQAFVKGTNVISAGIGLGGRFGGGYTTTSQSPGLCANFEHGAWEVEDLGTISIGGYLGLKSFKYENAYTGSHWNGSSYDSYNYKTTSKWSYTIIGVRSAMHLSEILGENGDLYGGLLLSYNVLSYKYSEDDPYYNYSSSINYGSIIGLTAFVGGRYYFNNHIGALAELGYGVSYLTVGASFKL